MVEGWGVKKLFWLKSSQTHQLIYPPNVETSRLLKSTLNLRSFQNFCAEITEKLWSFKIIAGDPKRVILSGH